MLIVSIAQVQTAYIWATFALNQGRSPTLKAPRLEHLHVTGKWFWSLFDKCNCFELKILIIFQAANLYGDVRCSCSRQTWVFFHSDAVVLCSPLARNSHTFTHLFPLISPWPSSLWVWLEPPNVYKLPGAITKTWDWKRTVIRMCFHIPARCIWLQASLANGSRVQGQVRGRGG